MQSEATFATTAARPVHELFREPGYALLGGHGLEIGALHERAPVPVGCTIEYADAITRGEAAGLFPEIDANGLVEPDHIRDLDKEGLRGLPDGHYAFVILSHVIEHVADPLAVLAEVFRVLRPGGLAVLAAPDKRYTFDRDRAISSYEELLKAHERGIQSVDDARYLDFLTALYPTLVRDGGPALTEAMASVRRRREHAHVWDSASFTVFLTRAMSDLGIDADMLYMVTGELSCLEHFSIWRKNGTRSTDRVDPS